MAEFNLVRNTRVFFTTNVSATTGAIPTSGATFTAANTVELQVLDGFSFKQGTQTAQIQLKEAGATPTRGQRTFNTSQDPVDFSFSTYIRPYFNTGVVSAEEQVLWNALMSASNIDTVGVTLGGTNSATVVGGTLTGITRADTATNRVTIAITTAVYTSTPLAVGQVVNVVGCTGANAQEWNQPAKVVSLGGSGIALDYLTAPSVAAGTAPVGFAAAKLFQGAWTSNIATGGVPAYGATTFGTSNRNQLQKFGMIFSVDGSLYAVDNCALDQAVIDFGLDAISMVAWTGKGTALRQLPSTAEITGLPGTSATFSGAGNATGVAAATNTVAPYITNKLSTMQLISGIQGNGGVSYTVALTGGSLTIANGIQYITPANLGVVNAPIGYFTGTRSITGTVTAYLKTGTASTPNSTAKLLSDILANVSSAAETKYRLQVEVGGLANAVRVEFDMDGCMLQVPTIETQDIIATTIGFTAQGTSALLADQTYDLGNTNDMTIRYFSA
jgi:hypothetical protein